jgi:undecaprenyl-phosphate 4-deoxy-4-formamido-L-arabinose transferase
MSEVKYSVVVPVFGAENSIAKLHEAICAYFTDRHDFEIIYVDDHSPDNGWQQLKKLQQKNQFVTAVRLSRNFGQHAATLCGFKYAKGDFIITLDDDLEILPLEIEKLVAEQNRTGNDLVYGLFKKLDQPLMRSFFTSFYKQFSKIEGKNKGKGSSFRLLKKSLAKKLVENHRHFVFIDELCLWYTDNVSFVKVEANKNYIRKKRYKLGGLFSLAGITILFSTTVPLRFVTFIGLSLSMVNFLVGLFYLIRKLHLNIQVPGFASLIVSILFSTGLIIFCIGILAQYLNQSLRALNNHPPYNEEEILC